MAETCLIIGKSTRLGRTLLERLKEINLFEQIVMKPELSAMPPSTVAREDTSLILYATDELTVAAVDELRNLHHLLTPRDIPLVAFCRRDRPEQRLTGLENGAADCLSLEMPPRELALRLSRHLDHARRITGLRRIQQTLERQATSDALTELYNRRHFDRTLEAEVSRRNRSGAPLSLLMLDVDHFKQINDRHGHVIGDTVLREIAAVLRTSLRCSDTLCRFGGEEFTLLMPGATIVNAHRVAERIRRRIERLALAPDLSVSVSIGVACGEGRSAVRPAELLEEADCALYAAKNTGRNRTALFTPAPENNATGVLPVLAAHFC